MFSFLQKRKIDSRIKKGQSLLNRGKLQAACDIFYQLVEWQDSAENRFHLGVTLLGLNRYEEAEKQFEIINEKFHDNYLNLLSLADSKLMLQKWDEAISILQDLNTLYPDSKSFKEYLTIAQDVVLREKYIKSKELMNEARELLNQKKDTEALEKLENALDYNPKNAHLLNNIGSVYMLKKQYEKAHEFFTEALSCEPENKKIQKNIIIARQKLKK